MPVWPGPGPCGLAVVTSEPQVSWGRVLGSCAVGLAVLLREPQARRGSVLSVAALWCILALGWVGPGLRGSACALRLAKGAGKCLPYPGILIFPLFWVCLFGDCPWSPFPRADLLGVPSRGPHGWTLLLWGCGTFSGKSDPCVSVSSQAWGCAGLPTASGNCPLSPELVLPWGEGPPGSSMRREVGPFLM